MEQQLAYSFHLGSDKNKSKLAKKVAKGNVSGTTSLSNNAIAKLKSLPTFWNALYLTNPVFWIQDPISLSNFI